MESTSTLVHMTMTFAYIYSENGKTESCMSKYINHNFVKTFTCNCFFYRTMLHVVVHPYKEKKFKERPYLCALE